MNNCRVCVILSALCLLVVFAITAGVLSVFIWWIPGGNSLCDQRATSLNCVVDSIVAKPVPGSTDYTIEWNVHGFLGNANNVCFRGDNGTISDSVLRDPDSSFGTAEDAVRRGAEMHPVGSQALCLVYYGEPDTFKGLSGYWMDAWNANYSPQVRDNKKKNAFIGTFATASIICFLLLIFAVFFYPSKKSKGNSESVAQQQPKEVLQQNCATSNQAV
eukprot:TRINITY_DN963_c0_g1_i1.p1 TRINITY_DN963_c0_g1~~TRINITY_DN963_c0_g1_i1.p1  ORF type:complete len:217 (+),score=32.80 TRINITY_DN963_c0_g1_i1:298-948(+)